MEEIKDNDLYTGREVKRLLRNVLEGENEVEVSTAEASRLLGHSPEWWRRAALKVPGAYQPEGGGPWSLPLSACREHLAGLRHRGKLRYRKSHNAKPFGRGPRKAQTLGIVS